MNKRQGEKTELLYTYANNGVEHGRFDREGAFLTAEHSLEHAEKRVMQSPERFVEVIPRGAAWMREQRVKG